MAKRSPLQRWDDAWDKWKIRLVPYKLNPKFLEGQTSADRDMTRRAVNKFVIHSQKEYDELLMTVSEWGYCVETPSDFNFAK
jgi:hypothetical protein